jgi:hypothetical protein
LAPEKRISVEELRAADLAGADSTPLSSPERVTDDELEDFEGSPEKGTDDEFFGDEDFEALERSMGPDKETHSGKLKSVWTSRKKKPHSAKSLGTLASQRSRNG